MSTSKTLHAYSFLYLTMLVTKMLFTDTKTSEDSREKKVSEETYFSFESFH